MTLIAITPEHTTGFERQAIVRLVESGFHRVHIRKPQYGLPEMRALIESLPASVYPYLSLHDHHMLALDYGLGGVNLNSRNREVPCGFDGLVSCSCHSIDEICARECDYYFLSPVFNSISKPGYVSAFSKKELSDALGGRLSGREVYALGGVDARSLPAVRELGFAGAALLGAIWRGDSFGEIANNIDEIWKNFNL